MLSDRVKFLAIAVVVMLAVAAWIVVFRRKRSRSDAAGSDADVSAAQRTFLLVVLRRAPIRLERQTLEAAARSAWAGRFGANRDGSNYVERSVPGVMSVLQAHGNAFTVIGAKKRGRTLQPPTRFIPESATGLWEEYTHDVSVGLAYNYDTDPARLATFVSTLTASLCDDQSLAVYHPASRRLWRLDEAVLRRLAEGSMSFFDADVGGAR